MDIKNIAISTKVVIESLVCLLENENVDLSSIKFKVGSASEGYESPDMEFEKLIDIALGGLEELKENPAQVPEGFVLVPIKPTETMVMAVVKEHEGDAFLPYSLYDAYVKQAMIEAQEQSHD